MLLEIVELLEILVLVADLFLVLFLVLFARVIGVLLRFLVQIEPLVKRYSAPGGGIPRVSISQILGLAAMKAVEAVDMNKVLGGLAK